MQMQLSFTKKSNSVHKIFRIYTRQDLGNEESPEKEYSGKKEKSTGKEKGVGKKKSDERKPSSSEEPGSLKRAKDDVPKIEK